MSPDPDIQAAWDDAEKTLADSLRPYVQDHLVPRLAREFIGYLSAEAWRPPLRRLPDMIRADRRRRALDGGDGDQP
ncbi:hypothetical protein ACFOWE_31360 [Planomonospora corallina]|uniref:Uncharacterized protein n=1 Tax=Planomonospora corallina TaxID=1806052 RepID=A0ABV8IFD6_9ACTN